MQRETERQETLIKLTKHQLQRKKLLRNKNGN